MVTMDGNRNYKIILPFPARRRRDGNCRRVCHHFTSMHLTGTRSDQSRRACIGGNGAVPTSLRWDATPPHRRNRPSSPTASSFIRIHLPSRQAAVYDAQYALRHGLTLLERRKLEWCSIMQFASPAVSPTTPIIYGLALDDAEGDRICANPGHRRLPVWPTMG